MIYGTCFDWHYSSHHICSNSDYENIQNKFSIRYIGKESNELEESDIVGVTDENYAKYLNLREVILEIDVYKEHKKIGVSKSNLFELQKKAKNGEKIKPQKETLMKILNYVKNKWCKTPLSET